MEEFPPNSKKAAANEDKKIERVTSADATRRKKPLGRKFTDTFFGGDFRGVVQYVLSDVLAPAAKDMIVEAGSQGLERFIFGETTRGRRPGGPAPQGHIAYNRMSQKPPSRPAISPRGRAQHNFDEVVLQSRSEGQEVLGRMYDILSRYESVTVSDLYELVGLRGDHTDLKWGWTDLHGATVERLRSGGFLLDLPTPEPLT
ncbi:MAG TPA: hypothetical protein PKD12_08110 [Nitrospira sp.]|nr:hypothetical protein [Nitrospira sp.]